MHSLISVLKHFVNEQLPEGLHLIRIEFQGIHNVFDGDVDDTRVLDRLNNHAALECGGRISLREGLLLLILWQLVYAEENEVVAESELVDDPLRNWFLYKHLYTSPAP